MTAPQTENLNVAAFDRMPSPDEIKERVPLSDAAATDAGEATASLITVDLGTVPGDTSHMITFQVKINP